MNKLLKINCCVIVAAVIFTSDFAYSQPVSSQNSADLQIALQKLNVLGSVLYVAAHPDDENTGVLAYFSLGKKYRTANLTLTRGDGGQNLIGSEKGAEMGIVRTQELLEGRKIDKAEQFFTRAIDFGYSKSLGETLEFWGKNAILSDIVWVIRKFRPDVIITRSRPGSRSGHGNHTASAALAKEAFDISGDPNAFPEQLQYVEPWKATRLLWNNGRFGQQNSRGTLEIDVGEYNSLLGKSYSEVASESRSMHKSQGFGSAARRGSRYDSFAFVGGEPAANDIFENVNTTWSRVSGGQKIETMLDRIIDEFDPLVPSKSIPQLVEVYKELSKHEKNYWAKVKKKELLEVIRSSAGLWMESIANEYAVSPGDRVQVRTTVINRSDIPFSIEKIGSPEISIETNSSQPLRNNNPVSIDQTIQIPEDFPTSQPYWLREEPSIGSFTISEQQLIGLAENAPSLSTNITLRIDNTLLDYTVPVLYRWTDRVRGELYRRLEIRPPVTANLESKIGIFADNTPKEITVTLKSNSQNLVGELRLSGPDTWSVSPATVRFRLDDKFEEQQISFTLTPPDTPDEAEFVPVISIDGFSYNNALVEIAYPHISNQVLFPKSSYKAVKLDIKTIGGTVGYIMGAGDKVPEALRNLGYKVTMLNDEALDTEDFSGFDAIITGVRAFNTNERLVHARQKLMDYVNNGGTFIVQYNVANGLLTRDIGPYPFRIGRDRVSVEDAPVSFPNPGHQLLNFPNRITQNDFKGWVQERGLYFATDWDQKYETVLSSHDPGESDKLGSILFAKYGKGVFIYTGISWFRELPAGVPGAFRLFENLISAGKFNGN